MRAVLATAAMLVGCGDDAASAPDASVPAPAHWVTSIEELPGAVLSVWAGDSLVYAVGADGGDGPMVLRHADGAWSELDAGVEGDLWWVAPDHEGNLWMVGAAGMVLRHPIGSDRFERVESGTDATLFGIFFPEPGKAWTVGGWVDDSMPGGDVRGTVLMLEGDAFVPDPRVPGDLLAERAVFKAWGASADDLWLVGERGLVLHLVDGEFQQLETGVSSRILTVHGSADFGPVAVGGSNNAVLLELDGGGLTDRSFDVDEGFAPALNGVHVVDADRTVVVGNRGFIAERDAAGDFRLPDEPPVALHLHAVTVDDDGGTWAVGGDLLGPFDRGLVLYKGPGQMP